MSIAAKDCLIEQQTQLIASLQEQLQAQTMMIEKLQSQLEQLLRKLYGKKSEKKPKDKGPDAIESSNQFHANQSSAQNTQSKGNGRRKLPGHLKRIRVEHDLPVEEKECSCCGVLMRRIGQTNYEQLEYQPAELYVKQHIRYKYACRYCQNDVVCAVMPNQPIEKGLAGPGLLAEILISKYQDAMPLYRQEQRFKRLGYEMPRSTLCGWVLQCAFILKPIVEAMKVDALLPSPQIYTDDTPLPIQAKKKTHTGRLWVYVATGVHGPPCTLYDYSQSRRQSVPINYLKDYKGYLQADAYAGYDKLYSCGDVIEVGCFAHARRKFYEITQTVKADSLADDALIYISQLYAIEESIKLKSYEYKRYYRRHYSKPILKRFHRWLKKQQRILLPKTPIAIAINYALNHWRALNRYCSKGFLNIDNNTAERAIKPLVIGRKNYLFAGSHEGAKAAAVIYSIIETCKQCDVNPYDYLKDVMEKIPNTLNKELHKLLPYHWQKSSN